MVVPVIAAAAVPAVTQFAIEGVLAVLDFVVAGMTHKPEAQGKAIALAENIRDMIEEDREPTPEEWAELDKTKVALNERLAVRVAAAKKAVAAEKRASKKAAAE